MRPTIGALATLVLLVGCGGSGGEDAETQPSRQSTTTSPSPKATPTAPKAQTPAVTVTIANGKVTPKAKKIGAKVGEPVRLLVTSDIADELHVHSDPAQSFEIKPAANQQFEVTVKVPGQVEIEAEELGVHIVTLVVRP